MNEQDRVVRWAREPGIRRMLMEDARFEVEPQTPTGRKVLAIHGSVLYDDVLGIEEEMRRLDVQLLVKAMDAADDVMTERGYTLSSYSNETYAPVVAAEYARLAAADH